MTSDNPPVVSEFASGRQVNHATPVSAVDTQMEVVSGAINPADYPEPTGYRILIEPIEVNEKTKGGLVLPQASVEAREHLRMIGRVIKMGPLCYRHNKFKDPDNPGDSAEPWCKIGDWVIYNAYAGFEIRVRRANGEGVKAVRFINDDEVLGVLSAPEAVLIYV